MSEPLMYEAVYAHEMAHASHFINIFWTNFQKAISLLCINETLSINDIASSYGTKIQNVYKEVYNSTIISSFDSVNTATINAFDKTWIRLENSNGEFRWKKE